MTNEQTIRTYDESAEALAEYFKGIGPRIHDIEKGLKLAHAGPEARVVEIGCGDGRDATEIAKRVGWYEGFDPSEGLLALAREHLPQTSFIVADALSYTYPDALDVVFSFASLLHSPKEDVEKVFVLVADALKEGGIFYISLKERHEYGMEDKVDKYGTRTFYFYTSDILKNLADNRLKAVYEDHQHIGNTEWFTMAFRKIG